MCPSHCPGRDTARPGCNHLLRIEQAAWWRTPCTAAVAVRQNMRLVIGNCEPRQPLPVDDTVSASNPAPPPFIAAAERQHEDSRYVVNGELARGGLGRVLDAQDARLGRSVAIKVLLASDAALRDRFRREAAITARLQHPAIVPVYDAGEWANGEPYYVMKLLDSRRTLKDLLGEARTLDARLALLPNVIAVAEAVAYAHSLGVIHRDLKPSNVVIGSFGETLVIDWGLAKVLDGSDDMDTSALSSSDVDATKLGAVVGTPQYMPPEQARGEPVDARADVYSLGALLYQVLAGRPPFTGQSALDVVRQVIENRPPAINRAAPGVPPDLAAIVTKAMAVAPDDRYASASGFVDDLKRFQTGQLVDAHRYSRVALLRRWLRRNRALVAVAVVAMGMIATTTAFAIRRIMRERDVARERQREAEQARAETIERSNENIVAQARSALLRDPTATIEILKRYPVNGGLPRSVRLIAAEAQARGVARYVLRGAPLPVGHLAFSPDGRQIASSTAEHRVRIWNAGSGSQLRQVDGLGDTYAFAWGPRSDWLTYEATRGRIGISSARGQELIALGHDERVIFNLDVSHAGDRIAVAGNHLLVWDVSHREAVELPSRYATRHVQFSPTDRWLAACGANGIVSIWDLATRHEQRVGTCQPDAFPGFAFAREQAVVAVRTGRRSMALVDPSARRTSQVVLDRAAVGLFAFSRDDRRVAIALEGGVVEVYDVATAARTHTYHLDADVWDLAFSPTEDVLAAGSRGGILHLFDLAKGAHAQRFGHERGITRVVFSPDGNSIATAGWDGSVRVWPLPRYLPIVMGHHEQPGYHVRYAASGDFVVTDGQAKAPRIWNLDSRTDRVLVGHAQLVFGLSLGGDRFVASSSWDGTARMWDLATRKSFVMRGHGGIVNDVAVDVFGTRVVTGGADGTVRLWSPGAGTGLVLGRHGDAVNVVALAPDARRALSAAADGTVRIWDLRGGGERTLAHHHGGVAAAVFSPDGSEVLSGGEDGDVCLWTAGRCTVLHHHAERVTQVLFSPDGRWIASSSGDGSVYLLDRRSASASVWPLHHAPINAMAIAPTSALLASASEDGSIRVLELASGRIRVLVGHPDGVNGIAFSPGGRSLASVGQDGLLRIWPIEFDDTMPTGPAGEMAWLNEQTTQVH